MPHSRTKLKIAIAVTGMLMGIAPQKATAQLAPAAHPAIGTLGKLIASKPARAIRVVEMPVSIPYTLQDNRNRTDAGPTRSSIKTTTALQTTVPTTPATLSLFDNETDQILERFAILTDQEPQDMHNTRLYRFIDNWYGVRYKYGGQDSNGIDCSGFTRKLYAHTFGVPLERTSRLQYHKAEKVQNREEATEGDLVFFRIRRLRISHVGVYLANGYFIHSSRSHGVIISSLNDKYWQRRYAGCGRIERPEEATESGSVDL
jgi:cell wall-associated NlpC family hydrolase